MASATPIVFVVDDDISVRESLKSLIRCEGWQPETFGSARSFLAHPRAYVPNCLILNIFLPDLTGLELQKCVAAERTEMPIIFVTDRWDVTTTVQAMKAGALDFLPKPISDEAVLCAVRQALARSQVALEHEAEIKAVRDCYELLTSRERQVIELVVSGLSNREVGEQLGISEITVKAHRGQVMQKMKAGSLADLVRLAARLTRPLF